MEQTRGKKYSWGCADQLLINKVLDQVKQQQKNLFMMWFDYRKAFHTLLHSWITKAHHLAKVPEKVLNAILRLMELWATIVNLFAEGTNIETESINYLIITSYCKVIVYHSCYLYCQLTHYRSC